MPRFGEYHIEVLEEHDRVKHRRYGWVGTLIGRMSYALELWEVSWDKPHFNGLHIRSELQLV